MTALLSMLAGAGIGLGVAGIILFLGAAFDFLNCACQLLTCNFNYLFESGPSDFWTGSSILTLFITCTVAGAVIGLVYGLYKTKLANDAIMAKQAATDSAEAKKKRIQMAEQIKKQSLQATSTCEKNSKISSQPINTTFKADEQLNAIVGGLADIAELKGMIDAMAVDIKTKGSKSI